MLPPRKQFGKASIRVLSLSLVEIYKKGGGREEEGKGSFSRISRKMYKRNETKFVNEFFFFLSFFCIEKSRFLADIYIYISVIDGCWVLCVDRRDRG